MGAANQSKLDIDVENTAPTPSLKEVLWTTRKSKKYRVPKIVIRNRSFAEAHRIQKTPQEVASANNNSSLLSQANFRQLEHQRLTALLMPKSPPPPYQQHYSSAPSSYEYISGETEMPPQHLSIQEGKTATGFFDRFCGVFLRH